MRSSNPKEIEHKRPRGAGQYRIQVLDRALRVLDVMSGSASAMGPSELSRALRFHKSTIHRVLKVLQDHHLVRRNSRGQYNLGFRLFELGSRSIERFPLPQRAEPYLNQLMLDTGETAELCVLQNTQLISVANAEAPWISRNVGHKVDLHATAAGKAFLACLPLTAQDALIGQLPLITHTKDTALCIRALKAELASIRRQGFSVNDQEVEEGVRGVAAPIFDGKGRVIASIGIVGPIFRITSTRVPEIARMVRAMATQLSAELGWQAELAS